VSGLVGGFLPVLVVEWGGCVRGVVRRAMDGAAVGGA